MNKYYKYAFLFQLIVGSLYAVDKVVITDPGNRFTKDWYATQLLHCRLLQQQEQIEGKNKNPFDFVSKTYEATCLHLLRQLVEYNSNRVDSNFLPQNYTFFDVNQEFGLRHGAIKEVEESERKYRFFNHNLNSIISKKLLVQLVNVCRQKSSNLKDLNNFKFELKDRYADFDCVANSDPDFLNFNIKKIIKVNPDRYFEIFNDSQVVDALELDIN